MSKSLRASGLWLNTGASVQMTALRIINGPSISSKGDPRLMPPGAANSLAIIVPQSNKFPKINTSFGERDVAEATDNRGELEGV